MSNRRTAFEFIDHLFSEDFSVMDINKEFKLFFDETIHTFNSKIEFANTLNRKVDLGQSVCLIGHNATLDEELTIGIDKVDQNYEGFEKHYKISLIPGIGQRITGAERYTDFSFYLTRLLPRLTAPTDYVCEIVCQDFDS
ncbi:MAG: hypothetical protein HOP30_22040 [Cyclobacteriaceae bacterium]|nr:hypothetical protein [Cyclobacteriaceae bacterium]